MRSSCSARRCPTSRGRSAPRNEVDPVRHLIGTAAGWGGNPDKDAIYLNVTPPKNDGKTIYRLTVKDVPVDGFWSVSVYNAEGYFEKNQYNAYSLNNITAKKSDGRLDRDPVRRLRRQDSELPADRGGLELHGAPLSAAARDRERQVDIPATAAGAVKATQIFRRWRHGNRICGTGQADAKADTVRKSTIEYKIENRPRNCGEYREAIMIKLTMRLLAVALVLALPQLASAQTPPPPPQPASAPAQQLLTAGQLDALVAPIALYPDALLSEILMASTYPLEVVEADRWANANKVFRAMRSRRRSTSRTGTTA